MSLHRYAEILRATFPEQNPGPRNNADGIAKLMVLVAQAVVQSATGVLPTPQQLVAIEADARTVMHAILDGAQL